MPKKKADASTEIESVVEMMDAILEDTGVPRNIRNVIGEAKAKVVESEDKNIAVVEAVYALDDISNDINMPAHTRTEIWSIISELENIKEKLK